MASLKNPDVKLDQACFSKEFDKAAADQTQTYV